MADSGHEPRAPSPNKEHRHGFRPSAEQLALLSRLERVCFEASDVASKSPLGEAYLDLVMGALIGSCGSNRMHIVGLEKLARYDRKQSVLLVANHTSFFDFFIITYILYKRTKLSKNIFFPTRSTFFYDHPLGPAVNLSMSAMRMFPPIMREGSKRAFNMWAIDRCVAELRTPGTIVGIHPEGTRNKSGDPYTFLPAQPGAGKVALEASEIPTIPVFVTGMGNSLPREFVKNWVPGAKTPIDVWFGDPIDFTDLLPKKHKVTTAKKAAERCVTAISMLGREQKAYRSGGGLAPHGGG